MRRVWGVELLPNPAMSLVPKGLPEGVGALKGLGELEGAAVVGVAVAVGKGAVDGGTTGTPDGLGPPPVASSQVINAISRTTAPPTSETLSQRWRLSLTPPQTTARFPGNDFGTTDSGGHP